MRAKITFKKDSPYKDEVFREVGNLIEVHYNYDSLSGIKQTAFESEDTGFTIRTDYIDQIEVFKD